MASARLQKWFLTLITYQSHIKYIPCKNTANADALNCLPKLISTMSYCYPGGVTHILDHLDNTLVTAFDIKL